MAPHFNFRTKQGPTVSVSNIRDIAFYVYSEIIRIRNFTIFTVYTIHFGQFTATFHFFYLHRGNRSLHVGPSDSSILNAGLTEKFLIVNHNEPEFKHQIISRNPGPTEKVLYNKRCIHISGLQISIIALILELLEILSEVIVGSICGPLSRIEKEAISENWTY